MRITTDTLRHTIATIAHRIFSMAVPPRHRLPDRPEASTAWSTVPRDPDGLLQENQKIFKLVENAVFA
jgi:hypothetical protein